MKTSKQYQVNNEFLTKFSLASITNAEEILKDSFTLLQNKSYARSYFLSIAALEEAGKAYLAFSAKGRNLNNTGLIKQLKDMLENHQNKITNAFIGWISSSTDKKEAIQTSLELMMALSDGREKSMYVDANVNNIITSPSDLVKIQHATDAYDIARNCIYHTKDYISNNTNHSFSSFDDKLFCLNKDKITKIFNTHDFPPMSG